VGCSGMVLMVSEHFSLRVSQSLKMLDRLSNYALY
jgi:hypothetical protein